MTSTNLVWHENGHRWVQPMFSKDDNHRSPRSPTSLVPAAQGNQNLLQALSVTGNTQASNEADMKQSFKVIYQHLHEKHYLDRLIHALHVKPHDDDHIWAAGSVKPKDAHRIAFASRIRVLYPRPAAVKAVLNLAKDQHLDLLYVLLTEPLLRFRICALAHLFEAALNLGEVEGEMTRQLNAEEFDYVLQKVQDIFNELFQQPVAQASMRSFLSRVYEATIAGPVATADGEEILLDTKRAPQIVHDIFPCLGVLAQEYKNLWDNSQRDLALSNEAGMLFKFVMLSLRDRSFAQANDYTTELKTVLDNLRTSLKTSAYYGPAGRLLMTLVSLADQLWEGGGATDTSLAIENCLSIIINKSQKGRTMTSLGPGIDSDGGWNILDDFERLVQTISHNLAPVPLPSIVWRRKKSEVCLDSMVVHFPRLLPNNINLNSTTEFDRYTNKLRRRWHLKISGLEAEAKNVAFFFATQSVLGGKVNDVGSVDLRVPANSLNVEIQFTINPLPMRVGTSRTLRESRETIGRKRPVTSADYDPFQGRDATPSRRRFSEPTGVNSGMTSQASRAGARVGRELGHILENEVRTAGQVFSRLFYPNQPHPRPTSSQSRGGYDHLETSSTAIDSFFLSRPRRRYSVSSQNAREPAARDGVRPTQSPTISENPAPPPQRRRINGRPAEAFIEAAAPREDFIKVERCQVTLRKLDAHVTSSKHPFLHLFAHAFLERQLRQAIEQSLQQSFTRMIETINMGVEDVMKTSHHEVGQTVPHLGHSLAPLTTQQRLRPMAFDHSPQKDSSFMSAFPPLSGLF